MCLYWKKMHTCNHLSDRPYIEMCREGFLSNTVCPDISEDKNPRPSHFPCYGCIKTEARAEMEAQAQAHFEQDAISKAYEARERAVKEKQAAEWRAKEERIRREARDKAAKERETEQRAKREKEDEERKAKKEGGAWIETVAGKKPKGRRAGAGAAGSPVRLLNSPPVAIQTVLVSKTNKENNGGASGERMSPKKGRGGDAGGRAGTWGPKKILSRQENGMSGDCAAKK
ncbi:hypothetical protein BDW02DRAFT_53698 [Decorospora gaudefroyi]|uniref:Uncharacterized protein n=1 Tax=Decorospora gaudefroyi TaxID=184978 RepID=A0A6A5KRK0_9PLEO|nr:hypothetical protein BDW02DRAFT_53698 [Decorospora gaudefroyi]